MKLDKNSYGSAALVYSICAAVAAALFIFVGTPWLCWTATGLLLWFCVWQTHFFLIPNRNVTTNNKDVLSVADGRVIITDECYEPEYLKRSCKRVAVYMNFFDYHANFWPLSGTVTYYKYHPGKHILAFNPKTSEENEHTCTAIQTPDGREIFFKQIAGGFARRIINYAKPGLRTEAGSQCGIIKFGSRIDIYLPMDSKITVSVNELVRACESTLAGLD